MKMLIPFLRLKRVNTVCNAVIIAVAEKTDSEDSFPVVKDLMPFIKVPL